MDVKLYPQGFHLVSLCLRYFDKELNVSHSQRDSLVNSTFFFVNFLSESDPGGSLYGS